MYYNPTNVALFTDRDNYSTFSQIRIVFAAVKETILQNALRETGIL